MRSWGNLSRSESAGNFLLLSLKNIFFPKENTQRGKIEKIVGGCNIALPLKSHWDFFLHLRISLWKTSWEPCTFRLTDDVDYLLYLTSWMPTDTLAHVSCTRWLSCSFSITALNEGKPRVHYVRKSNGSSLGRVMDVAVPAGWWAGWAMQRFLQLPSSLSWGDFEAKAYFSLSSQIMLETAHKTTYLCMEQMCWSSVSSLRGVPQAATLEWWVMGQWNRVRKRDRLRLKMPPPCH